MIKPAYSVSFLLSINIFVWQNVLYFPNDPRISIRTFREKRVRRHEELRFQVVKVFLETKSDCGR